MDERQQKRLDGIQNMFPPKFANDLITITADFASDDTRWSYVDLLINPNLPLEQKVLCLPAIEQAFSQSKKNFDQLIRQKDRVYHQILKERNL